MIVNVTENSKDYLLHMSFVTSIHVASLRTVDTGYCLFLLNYIRIKVKHAYLRYECSNGIWITYALQHVERHEQLYSIMLQSHKSESYTFVVENNYKKYKY